MTGRPNPLTVLKGGIDRLRPKGGARADALYDLVNAQLTKEYQVQPRPGTLRVASLPAGTIGLTAFDGAFHVYASSNVGTTQTDFPDDGEYEVPEGVTLVDVLVVGGGGGQSLTDIAGGGGGGGQVVVQEDFEVQPGDTLNVTVGAGGNAANGGNSQFDTIIAAGGGLGGDSGVGLTGGSGGGGSGNGGNFAGGVAGTALASDGGAGGTNGTNVKNGGGGGGAAEAGAAASTTQGAGAGGDGVYIGDRFPGVGVNGYVGGGGGGSTSHPAAVPAAAAGGLGGGGTGARFLNTGTGVDNATSGEPNSGGGAGGGATGGVTGGSGVVSVVATLIPEGYQLDVLLHPFDPDAELVEIHFAEPILGALYVVAEFDDGQVYHYWLQPGETWEADTEYSLYEFVTPTAPNGYVYSANRLSSSYPAWAPGVTRTAGNGSSIEPSIIEPTVYNEYYYTCIATEGDPARSGTVEPIWPLHTGETIVENTDGFQAQNPNAVTPPSLPSPNTPQSSTTDRYTL